MDIFKYTPVIHDILVRMKTNKSQREDLTQECYLALLEHTKDLEKGGDNDRNFAATICRSRVRQLLSKEKVGVKNYARIQDDPPRIRFDSLSDPKTYRKSAKVPSLGELPDAGLLSMDLQAGISKLSGEEFSVISLLLEGKTQEQIAEELGMTRVTVSRRIAAGVKNLRKYFGGKDGG